MNIAAHNEKTAPYPMRGKPILHEIEPDENSRKGKIPTRAGVKPRKLKPSQLGTKESNSETSRQVNYLNLCDLILISQNK